MLSANRSSGNYSYLALQNFRLGVNLLYSVISVGGEKNTNKHSGAKGFPVEKSRCAPYADAVVALHYCVLKISVGDTVSEIDFQCLTVDYWKCYSQQTY